ncbi:PVC-type heme-binding CxxCH protein [Larkinella insperata]|uniref:PVC-type heme-binding CxxCH protein n=1 Tax=Larkinella insperata TaxID=332158 RepID=A0ABW3QI71_9BACT
MNPVKNRSYTQGKLVAFVFSAVVFLTAGNPTNPPPAGRPTSADSLLTEDQRRRAENALKGLTVAPGLQVSLMAAEPTLKNPTNIDVDARGRIWVTEAYNYRHAINGNPANPAGDRILILEDRDGDGRTETSTVFYQGPELNAPMGVCVLGNRVLIAQSPYVWAFYDDNGDDRADRKEILFQGIGGEQHDHGMHTFTTGPDGKLYFNFGNEGKTLKDKNGQVVRDQDGDEIGPQKYRQGMVFRCNLDGSQVECLGHNFRNNYEVAVDSYGTMWQSDNDDDGNRGVRINYVMDYGNYGYTDEMTGTGWPANRTNREDSIPLRHWHLNDPGVIPNLLQTGSGSPTGMVVYEGSLLPEPFRNQMIHCEPGHNVVRAYPVQKQGAGYGATIVNLLKGENDQWFRPSDVCVAPDGSLIVADWYDPGVGGHGAGDQQKGRLYRIAPTGGAYRMPSLDYATPAGAAMALQNPNKAVQFQARQALQRFGRQAIPVLEKLWRSTENQRMRARAFWVLVKLPGGESYLDGAIRDKNPEIRISGLRAARQLNTRVIAVVERLVNDPDPQVRRECALALRHHPAPEAAKLWATLARQYDARDRWYLEALGIGADRQWDRFFEAYQQQQPHPEQTPAGRDLIWRARSEKTMPLLARLATDASVEWSARQRYFRAFDFNTGPLKPKLLLQMLADNTANNPDLNLLVLHHLDVEQVRQSAVAKNTLSQMLKSVYGTGTYIQLVQQYQQVSEKPQLMRLIMERSDEDIAVEAVRLYLAYDGEPELRGIIAGKDADKIDRLVSALGRVGYTQSIDMLQTVLLSDAYSKPLRLKAADRIGKSFGGEDRVLELLRDKKVPTDLIPALVEGLKGGMRTIIHLKASAFLPGAAATESEAGAFDPRSVLALKGDAVRGQNVFKTNCAVCHQVKSEGINFGPKLTEIGSKLAREGLLEAIVNPSAGISFGYETWEVKLKNGSTLTGLITGKTETEIDFKFPGGNTQKIRTKDVKSLAKLPKSLMPALHQAMNQQDLANLIEYLSGLTKS